jgi:prepilin-type N-terminal cleavage/methylation domain-containing protein
MKPAINPRKTMPGFTLIELMMTAAIMGVLASVALPFFNDYRIKARVTEGVMLLGELRRRVEISYNRQQGLTATIPSSPPADGQVHGGPYYRYSTLFGVVDDMWEQIEYQPKGPHRVLVLRAYRRPEWANSDIGLHLQIRRRADNTLDFRCTVNEQIARIRWAPSSCQVGNVEDWTSW